VFYHEAVATLLHLHEAPPAPHLASYDGAVQAVEAGLFLDWYLPWCGIEISDGAREAFLALWKKIGDALVEERPVTVLRDYHSVNLLWREAAQARFRIGLIDVQDALKGHAAYDVASLLCDARLDVSAAHHDAGLAHYCAARFGADETAQRDFKAAYATCAVQRNLKIAGIFVRLALRDKKPTYLGHMPRIIGYLKTHLAHPALADMADWMKAHAPHALDDAHE
jgi:aminoglycoside/choline kinase family phosphotransferase